MRVSWCDKLASTPTVGFKLSSHFAPADLLLDALSPILDRATEAEAKHFTIEQTAAAFAAIVSTNDGFQYSLDESKASVGFRHRAKLRAVSGGPPIMEMLSKPLPFTVLLEEVCRRLVEATLLLPRATDRAVRRVGVVSTTPISEDDIPPGVKRLIEYVGRPWNGVLEGFNIVINAQIQDSADVTERCIHTLIRPEDPDELLTIQFDWQRTYKTEWQITKPNLERILENAQKDSQKYFEDLAEGSRFDEVLIREAANA